MAYNSAYKEAAKKIQTKSAITGCVAGGVVYLAVSILYAVAAAGARGGAGLDAVGEVFEFCAEGLEVLWGGEEEFGAGVGVVEGVVDGLAVKRDGFGVFVVGEQAEFADDAEPAAVFGPEP